MYVVPSVRGDRIGVILPPKTGTRSLERWLRELPGAERIGNRHGFPRDTIESCDLVYASVRNPFDVMVSWFHYCYSSKMPFPQFLSQVIIGQSSSYLRYSTLPGAEFAAELIRYEHDLQSEAERVAEVHGWPKPTLAHVGKAETRRPYREYYSEFDRRMVETTYRQDFIRYKYLW